MMKIDEENGCLRSTVAQCAPAAQRHAQHHPSLRRHPHRRGSHPPPTDSHPAPSCRFRQACTLSSRSSRQVAASSASRGSIRRHQRGTHTWCARSLSCHPGTRNGVWAAAGGCHLARSPCLSCRILLACAFALFLLCSFGLVLCRGSTLHGLTLRSCKLDPQWLPQLELLSNRSVFFALLYHERRLVVVVVLE